MIKIKIILPVLILLSVVAPAAKADDATTSTSTIHQRHNFSIIDTGIGFGTSNAGHTADYSGNK